VFRLAFVLSQREALIAYETLFCGISQYLSLKFNDFNATSVHDNEIATRRCHDVPQKQRRKGLINEEVLFFIRVAFPFG